MSPVKTNQRYTRLDADESVQHLMRLYHGRSPFFFVRYGDGALECLAQLTVDGAKHAERTCDGERYSRPLALDLDAAWKTLMVNQPWKPVIIGDWMSASFERDTEKTRYAEEYSELLASCDLQQQMNFVHFEALLLMRESRKLVDFYREVKKDSRRKLFMGPRENAAAATMLDADFLETPMQDLHAHVTRLTWELEACEFDVLLYGCGLAGNIPAVRSWVKHPDRTYVNLGSAMDPLFRGPSRRRQLSQVKARTLFRELLA